VIEMRSKSVVGNESEKIEDQRARFSNATARAHEMTISLLPSLVADLRVLLARASAIGDLGNIEKYETELAQTLFDRYDVCGLYPDRELRLYEHYKKRRAELDLILIDTAETLKEPVAMTNREAKSELIYNPFNGICT
jgi:hypothetical protein